MILVMKWNRKEGGHQIVAGGDDFSPAKKLKVENGFANAHCRRTKYGVTVISYTDGIYYTLCAQKKESGDEAKMNGTVTNIDSIDVKVILVEQNELIEGLKKSLEVAKTMRENDPIYQQFTTGQKKIATDEDAVKNLEKELKKLDQRSK